MALPSRNSGWSVPARDIQISHIELQCRTIVNTISDNAATGTVVLAEPPGPVDQVDLRRVRALRYRNQNIERAGVAAALLSHPARGAWLADKLSQHDTPLAAGEINLAGLFAQPMWVERGDTVHADHVPPGAITCRIR